MQNSRYLEVKVWGDWACFTRPEMKVERVSYPVMTPAAARGGRR
jgi:CRISPR-associated protein Cas5d